MERGILSHPHRVRLHQDGAHLTSHPLSCQNWRQAAPMYSKPVTQERPQGHREEQLGLCAIFIFLSAQQVHQQKCHGLRREKEGEAMARRVNSQICSRQTGNCRLHTFSPMPDSPNRTHDRHLGTTCLALFLIKRTNRGWIPSAEAPIWRLSDLPPCTNTQMRSLFRGRATCKWWPLAFAVL